MVLVPFFPASLTPRRRPPPNRRTKSSKNPRPPSHPKRHRYAEKYKINKWDCATPNKTVFISHWSCCVSVPGCETKEHGLLGQPGSSRPVCTDVLAALVQRQLRALQARRHGEGGAGETAESPGGAGQESAGDATVSRRDIWRWVHRKQLTPNDKEMTQNWRKKRSAPQGRWGNFVLLHSHAKCFHFLTKLFCVGLISHRFEKWYQVQTWTWSNKNITLLPVSVSQPRRRRHNGAQSPRATVAPRSDPSTRLLAAHSLPSASPGSRQTTSSAPSARGSSCSTQRSGPAEGPGAPPRTGPALQRGRTHFCFLFVSHIFSLNCVFSSLYLFGFLCRWRTTSTSISRATWWRFSRRVFSEKEKTKQNKKARDQDTISYVCKCTSVTRNRALRCMVAAVDTNPHHRPDLAETSPPR